MYNLISRYVSLQLFPPIIYSRFWNVRYAAPMVLVPKTPMDKYNDLSLSKNDVWFSR